jgi:hypothetical protein
MKLFKDELPITLAQQSYIQQLCIDLKLNLKARNALVSGLVKREIKYLDELWKGEAGKVIEYLKKLKEDNNAGNRNRKSSEDE